MRDVMRDRTRIVLNAAPSVVTAFAIAASWSWHPTLRFDDQWRNYAGFIALTISIPISTCFLAFCFTGYDRFVAFAFAAGCALFLGFIAERAAHEMTEIRRTGVDSGFERIRELESDGTFYRLYRTNGGATTSYGLELRKERGFLPGIKLVSQLVRFYPAYDGTLEMVTPTRARLVVAPYEKSGAGQVYEFKL